MDTFIRVDASTKIGSGHVMRCLALAEAIRDKGNFVGFICRDLPGHLGVLVERSGFSVRLLSPSTTGEKKMENFRQSLYEEWLTVDWLTDADQTAFILKQNKKSINWLIVDHYALDNQWETYLRAQCKAQNIMIIDDLANRPHDCDLLLDQNLYKDSHSRYHNLLPAHCLKLLGPHYALLRSEFRRVREAAWKSRRKVAKIFVFFGGADSTSETEKALYAIQMLERPDIAVDVVVGENNPRKENIRSLCSEMPNVSFHCQVNNMAKLMASADLAIGASGSATWERLCVSLPSLVISTAENQEKVAEDGAAAGLFAYLGKSSLVRSEDIFQRLSMCINEKSSVCAITHPQDIVDGYGAERVAATLCNYGR